MKAVSYVKVSAEEQIEAVISVESQTCAEVSGHSLPLSSACASTFSIPLPRPTWWFCELKLTCHSVTTTQEKNLPHHCPLNRLATAEIWRSMEARLQSDPTYCSVDLWGRKTLRSESWKGLFSKQNSMSTLRQRILG